jgi:hypothetical protein
MVVAIDDLPPLLWHAEMGRSLPDPGRFWSGDRIELVAPFALAGEVAVR